MEKWINLDFEKTINHLFVLHEAKFSLRYYKSD